MDFKTTKHTVCINETVFEQNAEIPFDIDFTLPDYCPDITRILKCRVDIRVGSKSINGQNITVDGQVTANIIYTDCENGIYNYEQVVPFSKTIESDTDISNGCVGTTVRTEYVNCRAISERRIDVHGAAALTVKVTAKKKYDVIAEIDDREVQLNKQVMPAFNSVGNAEKGLLIEEELELSDGQEPIVAILRYEAHPVIHEVKAIRNKVIVKGVLYVTVLYCTENRGRYLPYHTTIPFNQFLDIEGVFEECRVDAKTELAYLDIKVAHSADPCRSMLLNAKLAVTACTYCNEEVPVVSDAFSTLHELTVDTVNLTLDKTTSVINDTLIHKETFDFYDGSIGTVIDTWTDTDVKSVKNDNGKICVEGEVTLCVLAYDTENQVGYFEKAAPFVYEKNCDISAEHCLCGAEFETVSFSYTILSDKCIELRIEYNVILKVREHCSLPVITDVCCGDEVRKSDKKCALIVYYASEGETIWDIAKHYNSVKEEICEINGLSGERLLEAATLLIPVY